MQRGCTAELTRFAPVVTTVSRDSLGGRLEAGRCFIRAHRLLTPLIVSAVLTLLAAQMASALLPTLSTEQMPIWWAYPPSVAACVSLGALELPSAHVRASVVIVNKWANFGARVVWALGLTVWVGLLGWLLARGLPQSGRYLWVASVGIFTVTLGLQVIGFLISLSFPTLCCALMLTLGPEATKWINGGPLVWIGAAGLLSLVIHAVLGPSPPK